jgi:hypothetical protein
MVEKPSEIMMKQVIPENLAHQKDGTLFNPFQYVVGRLLTNNVSLNRLWDKLLHYTS